MAFQGAGFEALYQIIKQIQTSHPEKRALSENFILEERLSKAREDSYARYALTPGNFDDWKSSHEDYLYDKIFVKPSAPETFEPLNHLNFLRNIEPDQDLVRLENLVELLKLAREDTNIALMGEFFEKFINNPGDSDARAIIDNFLWNLNRNRDHRPMFVGFWGEVKDLFQNFDPQWPDKLRDRFGLGHLDPRGEPIPVVLFRYPVSEVARSQMEGQDFATIPTVLDGTMNPFFFPTPAQSGKGQALDLSIGDANDYNFYYELIHRYIEYTSSHVYQFGRITVSPGKTCEEARHIHLDFLRDDLDHFGML